MNPNPLLQFDGVIPFDAIRPEHVTPAIDELPSRHTTTGPLPFSSMPRSE